MVVPKAEDTINTISYRTPKQIVLQLVKIGISKTMIPAWQTLLLGFMAGCYIGIAGILVVMIAGGFPAAAVGNPGLPKLLAGVVFPFGLMLVVAAGSELFTGNTMYLIPPLVERRITLKALLKNWVLSYTGNFIGSVLTALFLTYLAEFTNVEPWHSYVQKMTTNKITAGWGVNLLRGIGCNWLVCMALFCALASSDWVGKAFAIWWPVFAFVSIGFEHSVANMFYIPLGLMEGAPWNVGEFLWYNLIPVTLGNIIGGSIFVAMAEWAAYQSFFGEVVQTIQPVHGNHKHRHRHRHHGKHSKDHSHSGNASPAPASSVNGHANGHANGRTSTTNSQVELIPQQRRTFSDRENQLAADFAPKKTGEVAIEVSQPEIV